MDNVCVLIVIDEKLESFRIKNGIKKHMRVHVKFRPVSGISSGCVICNETIRQDEACYNLEMKNVLNHVCSKCYNKSEWIQMGGSNKSQYDDWGFCPPPYKTNKHTNYLSRYLTPNTSTTDEIAQYIRELVSKKPHQLRLSFPKPQVYVADLIPTLIEQLRVNYNQIYNISPEEFELLICNRLENMGLEIIRATPNVYIPDGGVDIIAYHKSTPFPALLAVQVKHHRSEDIPVRVKDVRELKSIVVADRIFNAGLLVTNTYFTSESEWAVQHIPSLLRLRDKVHLHHWLADNFTSELNAREFPDIIQLTSGLIIPKSKLITL